MSDERLRDLERAWRESGSWHDWEAWARRSRGDAARLARALDRAVVLDLRHMRVLRHVQADGLDSLSPGPISRELLRRIEADRDRVDRVIARLAAHVPHPRDLSYDVRGQALRAAVVARKSRANLLTFDRVRRDLGSPRTPRLRARGVLDLEEEFRRHRIYLGGDVVSGEPVVPPGRFTAHVHNWEHVPGTPGMTTHLCRSCGQVEEAP